MKVAQILVLAHFSCFQHVNLYYSNEITSVIMGCAAHRQHGLCPLPVSPLQQLDAVDVVTDLHQVAHHELGASSFGAGRDLAAARHVSFGQDGRVERPPVADGTRL